MRKEEEQRAKGLNNEEKKLMYFNNMSTRDKTTYDKTYINDNELDLSFLQDKKNYLTYNQRWRPFYFTPTHAKDN